LNGFSLIDQIKSSIEILMNMKVEEQDEIDNPDLFPQEDSRDLFSDRPPHSLGN